MVLSCNHNRNLEALLVYAKTPHSYAALMNEDVLYFRFLVRPALHVTVYLNDITGLYKLHERMKHLNFLTERSCDIYRFRVKSHV